MYQHLRGPRIPAVSPALVPISRFLQVEKSDLNFQMAQRMDGTENPYIEDVLESYSCLPNLTMMALGSSYWGPPEAALKLLEKDLS